MTVLSIIRDCLDALLHPSARYDALTRARHRAFMAPRLLGSLAAFAAFPVYLAMRGAPSAIEVAAFAWLIAPILLSWFLSRTGRYEGAHVLSSLALTGLVMSVAMTTGGIESFAARTRMHRAHPPFRNHIASVPETRRSPSALNERLPGARKAGEISCLWPRSFAP